MESDFKFGLSPSKRFNSFNEKYISIKESPSKLMKIAFYFILKALFILKMFKRLSWLFDNVKKTRIDCQDKVNCRIHDITTWLTNNYGTQIDQCLTIGFTSGKAFFIKKSGLEQVSMEHFLYDFWRKIFLLWYSINKPNFIFWLPLLSFNITL